MSTSLATPRRHWRSFIPGWTASPATRVALGLVALMVMLVLLVDMLVGGVIPNATERVKRERKLTMQMLASQVVSELQTRGPAQLQQRFALAMQKHPEIQSVAVLAYDGYTIASADHASHWRLAPDAPSTLENMRSTLSADGKPWGELQLSFAPAMPSGVLAWLRQPLVLGFMALALLGFGAFHLYLRRAMVYLDPSRVVPDRVRAALDTLTEGVLILDTDQKVMLANRAFGAVWGNDAALTGQQVDRLTWLTDAIQAQGIQPPWQLALQHNQPQVGLNLQLATPTGVRHTVLNCSPISDDGKQARGCLLTLSDVTDLHERTERLRLAMTELEASREEIRLKNEELVVLATRDPLTGCLNRRAFAAESATMIAAAGRDNQVLCCVMCDIDHFKRVNDTYGHAGGDVVLQAAAKALGSALRADDLLARFGGEEFCILLANTSLARAREITERLRANIEAHLGQALRDHEGVRITMSFGIEQLGVRKSDIDAVIDLADQALYHSKQNGRNRVTAYEDLPRQDG